ncbi:MAG TPA: phosphatase PAP2 family protein [Opitutaceae bacterium]|nr:phosphatase PAP2 family protein [Opitutaceae bacterium]
MFNALKRWWNEPGGSRSTVVLAFIVFVLAVWTFFEMVGGAVPGRYLELEAKILRGFRQPGDLSRGIGPQELGDMVRDVTALGGVAVLTLVVIVVVGFLALRGRFRALVLILAATISGVLFTDAMKSVVARDRPQVVPHLVEESSLSFPSGHSMMSSVVYLTLGSLLAQTMARRREKFYIVAVAVLLTLLVGVSRVYLGVHYPTDVLAGWSAGVAWAILFWGIAWWLQRRGQLRRPAN